MTGSFKHKVAVALFICVGLMGLTACKSSSVRGSDSLAAVEISGHAPLEIAHAISEVFQEAGYVPVPVQAKREMRLVFEREGSTGNAVLYGDWSFKKIWYRARVTIMPSGPETQIVTCDAYRVRDHNDPHFEDEQKLSSVNHGTYQALLEKAKKRVATPK